MMNPPYQEPLLELTKRRQFKNILEVGFGYGFSADIWLRTGAHVTSVDKGDWADKPIGEQFTFIQGDSKEVLPTLTGKYDLIFIDGDHTYGGCKQDILNALPLLAKNGIILLDDYGVEGFSGGVDFEIDGRVIDGEYGVRKAAEETLQDFQQVYEDIKFANGGRAYAPKSRVG